MIEGKVITGTDINGYEMTGTVIDKFTAIKPILFEGGTVVDLHRQEQDVLPVVTLYLVEHTDTRHVHFMEPLKVTRMGRASSAVATSESGLT